MGSSERAEPDAENTVVGLMEALEVSVKEARAARDRQRKERAMKRPPVGYTLSDLGAMFPHAHIEQQSDDDELVIYTGLTIDETVPGGSTLRWIDGMFDTLPNRSAAEVGKDARGDR